MYFKETRKSFIAIGDIYFYTATIHNWNRLLHEDAVKRIVTDSLYFLWEKKKIKVYAFVIMLNHIHLIWQLLDKNGKETSQGSFAKFTAHSFQQYLRTNNPQLLSSFAVEANNKKHEFWQRDPVAFQLTRKETALQKLDYIHNNPLAEHWQLCINPVDYYFSSARFYETGVDDFGFLTHIMDEF